MSNYNVFNWYWLADDGRLYSSGRQSLIEDGDEAYVAWVEAGGIATRWPIDQGGDQTDASLQEVLEPYGLRVDPTDPLQRHQFSFLEFMDLFPENDQLLLVEASMTLPPVKLWYDRSLGAQFIDLDDPRTEAGLQKLVDENLITAERKAAVMAGQRPN